MTLGENQIIADRYRILELLGEGSTGQVFRVWDTARQDEIALKLLHCDLVALPGTLSRITPLLSRVASLHHPGLASTFDYSVTEDHVLICQELVDGKPLANILNDPKTFKNYRKQLPSLIGQLIDTIVYASSRMPMLCLNARNVWVTSNNEIRITDTGLVSLSPPQTTIHLARQHQSEIYLAPEWHQVSNADKLGSTVDQFALGILLLELLQGSKVTVASKNLLNETSKSVQALSSVLARMTAPNAQERYSNLQLAKEAIESALDQYHKRRPSSKKRLPARKFLASAAIALFVISFFVRDNVIRELPETPLPQLQHELQEADLIDSKNREATRKAIEEIVRFPDLARGILDNLDITGTDRSAKLLWQAHSDFRDGRSEIALASMAEIRRSLINRRQNIKSTLTTLDSLRALDQLSSWYEQLIRENKTFLEIEHLSLITDIGKIRSQFLQSFVASAERLSQKTLKRHTTVQSQFMEGLLQRTKASQRRFECLFTESALPLIELHASPGKAVREAESAIANRDYFGPTVALQIAADRYNRWIEEWEAIPEPSATHRVNSLGMRFVTVGNIQVSIWETRRYDFAVFARISGHDARRLWLERAPNSGLTHPVSSVTRYDAHQFCHWLTRRERIRGLLDESESYALPSDTEWSQFVGLQNERGNTPEERSWNDDWVFPWGNKPIRSPESGNYDTWPSATPDNGYYGFMDTWISTAPVGRFPPNQWGLYDVGGNVWEWVDDSFDGSHETKTTRGGGFRTVSLLNMRSQARRRLVHDDIETGFRIIIKRSSQSSKDESL